MRRWCFQAGDGCPYCLEDTIHILHCPHPDAIQVWNEQFDYLTTQLASLQTEPSLMAILLLELSAWRKGTTPTQLHSLEAPLQPILRDLRRLSYNQFMEGLFPTSMIQFQQDYFSTIENCRKTGQKWGQKLYKIVWKMVHNIWQGRNEQLHNTHRIQELQGLPIVQTAIGLEFAIGLDRLPASKFSLLFTTPFETLLK